MPLKEEQQSVNAIAVKKETFIIEQNAKLSQKAETYVNADSDLQRITWYDSYLWVLVGVGAAVLVVMIVYQVMLNKKEAVRPA